MTPAPSAVLVVAPNWLGDAVMALPAIADVRRQFSSSRLVVAARASVADLFGLVAGVDQRVVLTWTGRWWDRRALRMDAQRLTQSGPEVAVLFPNSFAAAWLVKAAGVKERWGYAADLRGRLLTRPVRRPRQSLHQGAYYQHLTRSLGIDAGPLEPTLVVPGGSVAAARRLLADRGWNGESPLVVLAPGAAYGTAKRWIPAHVAALIATLTRDRGATCVLVGGKADAATMREILERLAPQAASVIDVTGATTLDVLAGLFSLARACVSNDSGAMHVAAAVGAPLVALFGPTREEETAPLTKAGGRAEVLMHPVWCRPCMLRECPIDHRCMTRISPARVLATIDTLLAEVAT